MFSALFLGVAISMKAGAIFYLPGFLGTI